MKAFQVQVLNEKITIAVWAHSPDHAEKLMVNCLQRQCRVLREVVSLSDVVPLYDLEDGELPGMLDEHGEELPQRGRCTKHG